MKNRRNAVLVAVLAVLVLLSALAGCSGEKAGVSDNSMPQTVAQKEDTQLQQAKEKLLEQWFPLLAVNEQVYAGIFRILEYAQDFARDNSWDSLLKARAACGAALVALQQIELPALELTEAETDALLAAGIEVNAAQREFEALENLCSDKDITATVLRYTLEDDVFLTASVQDAIPEMVKFYQDYFTLEYRYLCQFTNYLLLQMDAGEKWQLWQEELPYMAACADVWYDRTEDVEKATDRLLDEMEVLQTQWGSIQGTAEYTLELVQEAVETGNLDALRREINHMNDVPGYFPIPYWLPDTLQLYLVTDPDTQEKRLVKSGEELGDVPSACYISCGAVYEHDVAAYGLHLKQWGIETYSTWNETKDTWQLLAQSGNSTMMIEWTEDETLLYLAGPIGCLIPELYLNAMSVE